MNTAQTNERETRIREDMELLADLRRSTAKPTTKEHKK